MIYDRLPVALLSLLSTEDADSTNAQLAHYIVMHAGQLGDLSVRELARACHVGTGTVSRFAKDVGFASFAELRQAFAQSTRSFEGLTGTSAAERSQQLEAHIVRAIGQVEESLDYGALDRLVADLHAYERISLYGLLKAQAAATDLQVDLLMQGAFTSTSTQLAQQVERIACAGRDELIVIFSYTGSFYEAYDLDSALRRLDRPKVWVVCGGRPPLPPYVADCLSFASDGNPLGHPYQLEYVAGLIAQEYAARAY